MFHKTVCIVGCIIGRREDDCAYRSGCVVGWAHGLLPIGWINGWNESCLLSIDIGWEDHCLVGWIDDCSDGCVEGCIVGRILDGWEYVGCMVLGCIAGWIVGWCVASTQFKWGASLVFINACCIHISNHTVSVLICASGSLPTSVEISLKKYYFTLINYY